jgi:predicted ATP-grasp superfamily ATP-dependent carboligase
MSHSGSYELRTPAAPANNTANFSQFIFEQQRHHSRQEQLYVEEMQKMKQAYEEQLTQLRQEMEQQRQQQHRRCVVM